MTTTVLPLWLEVFKAVAPLLAAALAGVVAWWFGRIQARTAKQQADTAKNKLKLDLFDRRLAIYKAAADALSIATQTGDCSPENDHAFLTGIQGARWLFGNDVVRYLEDGLWHTFIKLHRTYIELKDAGEHEDRHELSRLHTLAMLEVMNHRTELDQVFAKYLYLES